MYIIKNVFRYMSKIQVGLWYIFHWCLVRSWPFIGSVLAGSWCVCITLFTFLNRQPIVNPLGTSGTHDYEQNKKVSDLVVSNI